MYMYSTAEAPTREQHSVLGEGDLSSSMLKCRTHMVGVHGYNEDKLNEM